MGFLDAEPVFRRLRDDLLADKIFLVGMIWLAAGQTQQVRDDGFLIDGSSKKWRLLSDVVLKLKETMTVAQFTKARNKTPNDWRKKVGLRLANYACNI